MAEMNDALSKLADIARDFSTQPLIKVPDYSFVNNIVPQIPTVEIDVESTFAYQMQQQTNQIIEKSNEQIKLLMSITINSSAITKSWKICINSKRKSWKKQNK